MSARNSCSQLQNRDSNANCNAESHWYKTIPFSIFVHSDQLCHQRCWNSRIKNCWHVNPTVSSSEGTESISEEFSVIRVLALATASRPFQQLLKTFKSTFFKSTAQATA
jgi:hypothetical protein